MEPTKYRSSAPNPLLIPTERQGSRRLFFRSSNDVRSFLLTGSPSEDPFLTGKISFKRLTCDLVELFDQDQDEKVRCRLIQNSIIALKHTRNTQKKVCKQWEKVACQVFRLFVQVQSSKDFWNDIWSIRESLNKQRSEGDRVLCRYFFESGNADWIALYLEKMQIDFELFTDAINELIEESEYKPGFELSAHIIFAMKEVLKSIKYENSQEVKNFKETLESLENCMNNLTETKLLNLLVEMKQMKSVKVVLDTDRERLELFCTSELADLAKVLEKIPMTSDERGEFAVMVFEEHLKKVHSERKPFWPELAKPYLNRLEEEDRVIFEAKINALTEKQTKTPEPTRKEVGKNKFVCFNEEFQWID